STSPTAKTTAPPGSTPGCAPPAPHPRRPASNSPGHPQPRGPTLGARGERGNRAMMHRALLKLLVTLLLLGPLWARTAHAGQAEVQAALMLLASETHTDVARGITDLSAADAEK